MKRMKKDSNIKKENKLKDQSSTKTRSGKVLVKNIEKVKVIPVKSKKIVKSKIIGDSKKSAQLTNKSPGKVSRSSKSSSKNKIITKSPLVVPTPAKKKFPNTPSIALSKKKTNSLKEKSTDTKHIKVESLELSKRERSRKKLQEIEKKEKAKTKIISKAKARIKEFANDEHDDLLSSVKAIAKKSNSKSKNIKKQIMIKTEAFEDSSPQTIRPKGIKRDIIDKQKEINNIKKVFPKEETFSDSEDSSEEVRKTTSGEKREVKKPIKQIFKGIDTKGISEEISKIIKRIEEKKKKPQIEKEKNKTGRKSKSVSKKDKSKASEYNYKLQRNKNIKTDHIIDIHEVASKTIIKTSEIMLSLLELGTNPEYYQLTYSPNSIFFWDDVMQYNEIKVIFKDFKPETMKKYWRDMSKIAEAHQVGDLLRKYSDILDQKACKFKCIITGLKQLYSGKIDNFEEYVIANVTYTNNLLEVVDPITGELLPTKPSRNIEFGKLKFTGNNYRLNPDEIINNISQSEFTEIIKRFNDDQYVKRGFGFTLSMKESELFNKVNSDERYAFDIVDLVIEDLRKHFPNYDKDFIFDALSGNSMNIKNTYDFLMNPIEKSNKIFNNIDDDILRSMKDSIEYNNLVKIKGEDRVKERMEYLNIKN